MNIKELFRQIIECPRSPIRRTEFNAALREDTIEVSDELLVDFCIFDRAYNDMLNAVAGLKRFKVRMGNWRSGKYRFSTEHPTYQHLVGIKESAENEFLDIQKQTLEKY